MPQLQFDPAKCSVCTTYDCLVKCQYTKFDQEKARAEIEKLVKGEDCSILHDCATCYGCEEYCPFGNHPFYYKQELREQKGILTASRAITSQWVNMTAPAGKSRIGQISDVVLSHCFIGHLRRLASGRLFEDVASSFVLGTDFFCNVVFAHFAKPSVFTSRMPRVVDSFASLGFKELICLHDECYAAFNSMAPAYGIQIPFKTTHYFEYLHTKLRELQGQIRPLGMKAVYQRPCSSRLIPDTQHWVDEIFALIGVERVPRQYEGENALCCGEIIRMIKGYDAAEDVQMRNIEDMVSTGAQICVFNCPMCYLALGEKVAKRGLWPLHMIEVCRMALGEKLRAEA